MAQMSCEEFWGLTADWLEGERRPEAVAHVAGCSRCRGLVADLDLIRKAGADLTVDEKAPAHLWRSIRAQLEKEGVIRQRRTGWWERLGSFGALRPAVASAYLSLVIAGAVFLGWQANTNRAANNHEAWLNHTQKTMAPLVAEFGPQADVRIAASAPLRNEDVTATLNRNLAIVDNMIAMCEKSVREDPQNEMTRDYLYTAYQQKADLLTTMAESEGR
ncbi:MAG: hypothetical protein WBE20_16605 [Candidatus Acidiferrales bacterium]